MNSIFDNSNKKFFRNPISEIGLFSHDLNARGKNVRKRRFGINIQAFFAAAVIAYSTVAPASSLSFSSTHSLEPSNVISSSDPFVNSIPGDLIFNTSRDNSVGSVSSASSRSSDIAKSSKFIAEDSFFGSASIDVKKHMELDFPELQANTLSVLDANEIIRLNAFKKLSRGWDFGSGETLNAISLRNFDRFFAVGDFRPEQIATFMSDEGNLIVSWSCKDGDAELEFAPSYYSYIDDSLDEARRVSTNRAADFRNELTRNLTAING